MLKNLNYSLIFLSILVGRVAYKGADIGDAIAILGLAGLYAYGLYLEQNKPQPLSEGFRTELDAIKDTINSLKIAKTFGRL